VHRRRPTSFVSKIDDFAIHISCLLLDVAEKVDGDAVGIT